VLSQRWMNRHQPILLSDGHEVCFDYPLVMLKLFHRLYDKGSPISAHRLL